MTDMNLNPSAGDILKHEFLEPLGMSGAQLARNIGVPQNRVTDIIRSRRGITAETALRLARFFGTSAQFWMGLQIDHDLYAAKQEVGDAIQQSVKPMEQRV
jgi:antitoxin HigA-1